MLLTASYIKLDRIVKDIRAFLEKPLKECGAKGCDRRVGPNNSTLQVCSRQVSSTYPRGFIINNMASGAKVPFT